MEGHPPTHTGLSLTLPSPRHEGPGALGPDLGRAAQQPPSSVLGVLVLREKLGESWQAGDAPPPGGEPSWSARPSSCSGCC